MSGKSAMTKTDVPSFCFAAGTQVQTHAGLQKIETLHVGQRVLADASDAEHSTAVRAGDWRRVEFTFADPHTEDGKLCRVVLLRPAEHVAAQGWRSGGEVEIDFGPEVQRESGDARIVSITPAAEPEHGAGQVVTGTFQTWHRDLRELWMEGLEEPVRVTSGHRFYSASREAWIDAHHLQVGETVRTRDGAGCRVLAVTPLAGEHAVFNIEVETLHQYHVTSAGLLTHNNGNKTTCQTGGSAKGTKQANEAAESGVYEIRGKLEGVPTGYAGSSLDMDKRLSDPKHPARRLMDEGEDVSVTKKPVDITDASTKREGNRILRTNEQLSQDEMNGEGMTMLNKIRARAEKKFERDLKNYGDRRSS
jgi:hypothetical protein